MTTDEETSARSRVRLVVDALTDARWQTLVDRGPSDVFHSPSWLRVLAKTYGYEPRAAILLDEHKQPVAGLPYCTIEGIPARRIAAPPFSDFCDPIVSDLDDWRNLIQPLLEEGCRVTLRCLHNEVPLMGDLVPLVDRAKWHGLDLRPGTEAIWQGLHGSARRAVRKARSEGVTVRPANDVDELRKFYELHLRVRKYKYRLLAQPYAFFASIWDEFVAPGNGELLLALQDDAIIGGVFFLEWKDVLYYKFNASDPSLVSSRPNDLVIWSAIERAQERGLTLLDFGLSDWDQDGLVRYKRKYASEEKTISFLRHDPAGDATQEARQVRELLPGLTDLFTKEDVPDGISERAGELLYRFFA